MQTLRNPELRKQTVGVVTFNINRMFGKSRIDQLRKVQMKKEEFKKVLILSASPRRKGNSQILCYKFAEGAKSTGHQVKMLSLIHI